MKLFEKTASEVYAEFLVGNLVVKRTKWRFSPVDQATEWINRTWYATPRIWCVQVTHEMSRRGWRHLRRDYRTPEHLTTNHATLQLFGKPKKGLEILPPTRDTLELHAIRANYRAKI